MLCIAEKGSGVSARNLTQSENVFHEALTYVHGGETAFHVICPDGEYWLNWRNNEEIQHARTGFPNAPLFTENLLFPDYLCYAVGMPGFSVLAAGMQRCSDDKRIQRGKVRTVQGGARNVSPRGAE